MKKTDSTESLHVWWVILAVWLMPWSALAGQPTADPIFGIEVGVHSNIIKAVDVDPGENYLLTTGNDKTARLWDVHTGQLIRVFRPPVGDGHEGKLWGGVFVPNTSFVAVGGWTGYEWDMKNYGYIFDIHTGELVQRFGGTDHVINSICASPDGGYLVMGHSSAGGITVWSVSGGFTQVSSDSDYSDSVYGCDFDSRGRLVTASFDGGLRLYDSSLNRIGQIWAPEGSQPYAVRFSPDDAKISVGFNNYSGILVYSAHDLSYLYQPVVGDPPGDIFAMAWSTDGRYLYGGGTVHRGGQYGIVRWELAGRGDAVFWGVSDNAVSGLEAIEGGYLSYAGFAPEWGLFDMNGKLVFSHERGYADLRVNTAESFLVSANGEDIRVVVASDGSRTAGFSVSSRQVIQDPSPDPGLASARTAAPGMEATNWEDSQSPLLNGASMPLAQHEMSRSIAISLDGTRLLLGSDWNVRMLDSESRVLWSRPVPNVAWGVNLSSDGRLAVAALGDGTIRWYRASDGAELLTLFLHADCRRWVAWTPSGYYMASPGADELVGWHLNNGKDKSSDFFPIARFREVFYRPDAVDRVLALLDEGEALRQASEESGRRQAAVTIQEVLPPVVTILSPQDGTEVNHSEVTVRYRIDNRSEEPVTGVRVYLDGRPAPETRGLTVEARPDGQSVMVVIPDRDVEISLIAENRRTTSEPARVQLKWVGQAEEFVIKPNLYVLAIGVSKYEDESLNLGLAAKDAQDFAKALESQKGTLYREVITQVLPDATRDQILDGLEWIEREATSKDVAMLFLAGHGVNDPNGNYVFLPSDASLDKLKRTGVPYSMIRDTVTSLPGKVVFFVDTCHSGNIMGTRRGDGDIDSVVNDLTTAENGVVVFAASTGRQYSLEDKTWGNGAFTKALVEGLTGKADYSGNGRVTINMLDLYLSERVKELTGGQQTPTTTKPKTIQDFPIILTR